MRLTVEGFETATTFHARPFNIRKALESSFGAFQGGKPETIRLRFWGRAGRVIPEFFWHKSQVIEPVPGEPGAIDLTLRVAINPRFVGWIGEWLREIAVLQPNHLRQTLVDSCDICKANQLRIGSQWDAAQKMC